MGNHHLELWHPEIDGMDPCPPVKWGKLPTVCGVPQAISENMWGIFKCTYINQSKLSGVVYCFLWPWARACNTKLEVIYVQCTWHLRFASSWFWHIVHWYTCALNIWWQMSEILYVYNVVTNTNHSPVITIFIGGVYHSWPRGHDPHGCWNNGESIERNTDEILMISYGNMTYSINIIWT
jgi:hypothetical protein